MSYISQRLVNTKFFVHVPQNSASRGFVWTFSYHHCSPDTVGLKSWTCVLSVNGWKACKSCKVEKHSEEESWGESGSWWVWWSIRLNPSKFNCWEWMERVIGFKWSWFGFHVMRMPHEFGCPRTCTDARMLRLSLLSLILSCFGVGKTTVQGLLFPRPQSLSDRYMRLHSLNKRIGTYNGEKFFIYSRDTEGVERFGAGGCSGPKFFRVSYYRMFEVWSILSDLECLRLFSLCSPG